MTLRHYLKSCRDCDKAGRILIFLQFMDCIYLICVCLSLGLAGGIKLKFGGLYIPEGAILHLAIIKCSVKVFYITLLFILDFLVLYWTPCPLSLCTAVPYCPLYWQKNLNVFL